MGLGSKGRNKGKLETKQVKAGVYCSKMCLGELITSFCNVLDPFSKFGIWNYWAHGDLGLRLGSGLGPGLSRGPQTGPRAKMT